VAKSDQPSRDMRTVYLLRLQHMVNTPRAKSDSVVGSGMTYLTRKASRLPAVGAWARPIEIVVILPADIDVVVTVHGDGVA